MKSIITLVLSCTCMLLSGCNTLEGVGKDIKKAGSTVEEAAKKK